MAMISQKCRMLEKHKYWTEFQPTRHQFFKIMIGDFENQLRIPRKFISNFKEKLSDTISLRGPSGCMWTAKIAKTDEDVLFHDGWEEFVKDHCLAETDFLVFRYSGNSTFNVIIFGKSGCEREGSYFVKKHTSSCSNDRCVMEKQDPRDSGEDIDLDEVQEGNTQKGNLKRGRENQSSKVVGTNNKHHNRKGMKGMQSTKPVGTRHKATLKLRDESEEDLPIVVETSEDWTSANQKKFRRADEDERKTSPEVEIIPSKFERKKKRITHNASQVDVSKKFNPNEEENSEDFLDLYKHRQGNRNKGKNRRGKDEMDTTLKPSRFHPFKSGGKKGEGAQSTRSVHLKAKSEKKGTMKSSSNKKQSYSYFYISSRRQVTEEERKRAHQMATLHSYSSTRPLFLVTMKPTHVHKFFSVNIKREWANKHISTEELEILLRVPSINKKWIVRFQNTPYKSALTRGWSKFVLDNNLEEDDVCIFELNQGRKAKGEFVILDVTIFRVMDELVPLRRSLSLN